VSGPILFARFPAVLPIPGGDVNSTGHNGMEGRLFFAILAVAFCSFGCRGPRLELKHQVAPGCTVTNETFRDSLAGQIRSGFLPGNRIEPLVNGDRFVPAMLAAIRAATNSINIEAYIWQSGRMSDEFVAALTERAHAGVEVRCLADALGTLKLRGDDVDKLRGAGVKFVRYNKPHPHLLHRLNFRDHRKLMVVDGRVGFTGGACIGDSWLGDARTKEEWRDTQFRVQGPAVAQMQGIFGANWLKAEGEMLFGEKFYPKLDPVGDCVAQNFASGPRDGGELGRLVYLSAIAAAQKHIRLEHSYFVPDDLAMDALRNARARGVEIELITAGNLDAKIVRQVSRQLWPELLRAGVKIYEFGPAMLHTKILIVDDYFVSCGSVNFDERSFRINDEANMNVLNRDFAARMVADFEHDKQQCKPISLEDVKSAPWHVRMFGWFTSLFRSQL
jgi:cardiolipin synthase A/B